MLEVIEKLLILQDRDRMILNLEEELARIGPERQSLEQKASLSLAILEERKAQAHRIESERKRLELEVEDRKQKIERYSLQQFQTKKNEEYRALANEIETCQADIVRLEDQQLELMEQGEQMEAQIRIAKRELQLHQKEAEEQIKELNEREQVMQRHLREAEDTRGPLAEAVEPPARSLYERLFRNRGKKVVVGIEHGVCGGCHMKLPVQVVVSCRAQKEIIICPNCSRILYFTPHMEMTTTE